MLPDSSHVPYSFFAFFFEEDCERDGCGPHNQGPEQARGKMASIRDVARRAEVAIGTVSRVLNGGSHVTDLTRQRVQKAIKELGYKPNPAARALRSNRTHLIALTLPELTNPFYAAIVEGVRQVLEPADFRLILCSPNSCNNAVPQYIDMLANRYIDGLIVVFDRFSAADKN